MSTYPLNFSPVAGKIWLDSPMRFVEDEDREYYLIAKERLTAIAEGYPYVLPDGFRFAPLQNRKTYKFPYEIVLPDGKVVKTENPDTAEFNARIAEAAIYQKYGIIPTTTATTTPAATTPEPTPAPSVVIPESTVNTSAPSVVIPESTKQSPLQVPTDFAQAQAEAEANDEKSSLIVGGLVLLGGFLIIRYLRKKK